jgi:hypothetical protein
VAIGKLLQVRHNTVSRWLARVNVFVEHEVRSELGESLKMGEREVENLVRSVLSRVDTSIRGQVARACDEK